MFTPQDIKELVEAAKEVVRDFNRDYEIFHNPVATEIDNADLDKLKLAVSRFSGVKL